MKVYLSLVKEEKDISATVLSAINAWLGGGRDGIELLPADQDPGLLLIIKNKFDLKDPLNALYAVAKQEKCDFVVGYIEEQTNSKEDVCYFGHEEGRPDLHEIACYLGL